MSFVQYYLTVNVLFVIALLLTMGLRAVCSRLRRPPSWKHQLYLAYALVIATLLAPFVALPSSSGDFLPKAAQLWSAPSMQATQSASDAPGASVSLVASAASMPLD